MDTTSSFLGLDFEIPETELVVGEGANVMTDEQNGSSDPVSEEGSPEAPNEQPSQFLESQITTQEMYYSDLQNINQNLHFFVNVLIPLFASICLVITLCRWFYKRFFDQA